ncbi:MAG: TolC family protein [Rhodospirillaceae bacterium]|nr:TolC family protein [Rhodospirillaceae bacterium]
MNAFGLAEPRSSAGKELRCEPRQRATLREKTGKTYEKRPPTSGRGLKNLALWIAILALFQGAAAAFGEQHAQRPPRRLELRLSDAIAFAIRNNRRLINARLDRVVQKYALMVAEDKFRPHAFIEPFMELDASGQGVSRVYSAGTGIASRVILRIPTGGQFAFVWTNSVAREGNGQRQTTYDTSVTLSFVQPLLRGGGVAVNTASVKTARLTEQIQALAFRSVIGDLITSVIQTYRSLIQAQQSLEISERSLQRAKDLLAVNRLLIQAGRMAERDIIQTEADVAERELNLTGDQNSLEAARLALIDVLDIDSQTQLQATEALSIDPAQPDMARSLELALQHRPDYLQALLRIENAETDLLLARNNRRWDLFASSTVDFSNTGDSLGTAFSEAFGSTDKGAYRVGLDLSIPLGDLTLKQQVLSATTALKQARNDVAELRQSIEIAVRNAVREVDVRFRQVDLARRARELAEQKLETEQLKLRLGLSTNFRLVTFEDDLVRAQNRELDAIIAYLNTLTGLDRTLGTTLETWGIDIERVEE